MTARNRIARIQRRALPLLLMIGIATAAAGGGEGRDRTRLYRASPAGEPVALELGWAFLHTTRWDLTAAPVGEIFEERLRATDGGLLVERWRPAMGLSPRVRLATRLVEAPAGLPETFLGQAALPEELASLDELGAGATIEYRDARGAVTVEATSLARGWVHTPAGPFLASLRREEVLREGARGLELQEVRLRWVNARLGTVALARITHGARRASGPGALPELGRDSVDSLSVLASPPEESLAEPRIYHREFLTPPPERYTVALEQGENTAVNDLTPDNTPLISDLMALSLWDFSGNTTGLDKVTTVQYLGGGSPYESCNAECPDPPEPEECGYCNFDKGGELTRVDTDPGGANQDLTNAVFWDDGDDGSGGEPLDPDKITVYLLAGRQHEDESDFFGDSGEGGFCYDPDEGKTPVPDTVYGHKDGDGYYYTLGDHWESAVFNCEQNLYDLQCGEDDALLGNGFNYTGACQAGSQDFLGKQLGDVLQSGTVVLPNGGTYNVVVLRTLISFCVYITQSACQQGGSGVEQVNKYVTLFNAPHLITLARLDSFRDAPNPDDYNLLEEAAITIALLPPVTLDVTGTTTSSVTLSWDPGDTRFIDRHKVYWGTESGVYTANSDDNAGQVSGALTVGNTSVTITGLTQGQRYFFTVSSLDTFANPSTGTPVEYESPLFATKDVVDPDFDVPDEVGAVPGSGCFPAEPVRELAVMKAGGGNLEFCWTAVGGACVDGYELLGSSDASSAAGFGSVGDPGTNTCITVNPGETFFLSVADGPAGFGPWGHYGR